MDYSDDIINNDFPTVHYESNVIDDYGMIQLIQSNVFKYSMNALVIPMSLLIRLEFTNEVR